MAIACRIGWHNWSEWEDFTYEYRGPSWPYKPAETKVGMKRYCNDCKIKTMTTADQLWDDRKNWFGNDGIDCLPMRCEAALQNNPNQED